MLVRIVITPGEPAGIGPDLVLQLAQQNFSCECIVVGDPDLFKTRAAQLDLPLSIQLFDEKNPSPQRAGYLCVLPISLKTTVTPGKLDKRNSPYVMETLTIAATGCLEKKFHAMVTGPVHKGILCEAGFEFTGHTEWLAKFADVPLTVMLLAAKSLRVALATTHLPLREIPKHITPERLTQTIEILVRDLKKYFQVEDPKILVCGLNPHAGENGHLGDEEQNIIIPTLEKLRKQGLNLIGPVPADTAFIEKNLNNTDVVLAMYHDQGLPIIKHLAFESAVNITLGLPFLRTSVDHGTALELAGTGQAHADSLLAAINTALSSKSL